MSNNVFDFVKAVNTKQDLLAEGTHSVKDYVPFIVNKALSYFPDTVKLANEMNRYPELPGDMQFYFLMHSTRKAGNRFAKWAKPSTSDDIEVIKTYYGLNSQKAAQTLKLLTEEQIAMIRERVQHGGEQSTRKKA